MSAGNFGGYGFSPDLIAEAAIGLHQILPVQFFDRSGGHRLSAEQRLMLAVLGDAIRVYRQGVLSRAVHKRMLYVDVERWLLASDRDSLAFGFETVCQALDIDPSVLRHRLISWKHLVHHRPEACSSPNLRLKTTTRNRRLSHRAGSRTNGSAR